MSSKSKPVTPPPDPKAVYDHADRFHITEFFLRNKLQVTEAEFKTIQIPGMVISAFAAELYLKSLLILDGKPPPGEHHLHKLFQKLSDKAQAGVRAQWDKMVAQTDAEIAEVEKKHRTTVPRELATALSECGDSFQLLRYVYEGDKRHKAKFYITQLPLVVRNAIREVTGWK